MSAPDLSIELLRSLSDTLGEQVLAGGADPSYDACAALLPELLGYTFLANEAASEVIYVAPDGTLGVAATESGPARLDQVLFDPRRHLPADARPTNAARRLIGGYMPGIDYSFKDTRLGYGWQELAFIAPAAPELYVSFRVARGAGGEATVSFRAGAEGLTPISPEWFRDRRREFEAHWQQVFADAMRLEAPAEAKVLNASLASLARAFVTHDGPKPRYGVGLYRDPKHNHFPPATIGTANACVEWNLLDRARAHLDYYLDNAVRADGTFDYYGPAVSEYGQLLDAVARYARRSRDAAWLRARVPVIERIIGLLLALRRHSQETHPRDDPRHGLLLGSPEADTRDQVGYYYAGSIWAWRGWLEVARAYALLGGDALRRRAADLGAECQSLRTDIDSSLEKSIIRTTSPIFVPPAPGIAHPFESMTADPVASYTNYRYWPEMLSADYLLPEWHDAIIAYRASHGGELLGTTRFLDRLDDWPYAHHACGLLLRGRVRHFLLGFYGHLAIHHTRGTFMAYEQVAIRGKAARSYVTDYCVPAQLVTPLLAKWMLVFEEPDADVLWLCRATPRRWLAPGPRVHVDRATTRWGPVSVSLEPKSQSVVHARIQLPRADFPAQVRLCLRRPGAAPLRSVTVNGHHHADFDPQAEAIRLHHPQATTLEIVAQ